MSERTRLPYVDLLNWLGLYTKGSNEVLKETQLRDSVNTDFFTEYGAFSKPPGSSRVLASAYTESSVAQKVTWLGFYKAADLDGSILRHVIVAAGTILHRLTGTAGSATLTALTGSGKPRTAARTAALFHTSTVFDDFMLIQNQDPDLVGSGDEPVKYDGNDIQLWGLIAPGSAETIQDDFSDSSTWTVSGGTASDESTITQNGDAVKVTKTSTGQTNLDLTKTLSSTFSVSTTVANRGFVFLYIPRGELPNFAETQAVQIFVGSDANLTTNFYRFDFDIGQLVEGWNQLFLDFSSPTATDGSPSASGLQTIRVRANSLTAATLISNLRWDKFTTYDAGVLTSAQGATGTVFSNGATYSYKVTYVNKYGHESNAGPASTTLTISGARDDIDLSSIPTSSDPQVIARKIYRTVNGGSIHLFLTTINDNTTTTYEDTTADTALGQTSPPLAGDLSDDNSPPPKAGIVKKWKRTIFLSGDPTNPTAVYFSENDEPESFPTLNAVNLDDKVTAIYETYSGLVVETETGKWHVTGDNPDFRFDKIISQIGCVGRRAAGETRIMGWAMDRDGMRLYDLNNPIKISEPIRDKFDSDFNKSNIELTHTVHSRNRNAILMFIPDSSGNYTSENFVYQYPVDEVTSGWWWELQLPSTINPQHVVEVEDSNGDFHLYFGGDDGQIYELFDSSQKDWATVSGTSAISTTLQTKYFRPGELGGEVEGVTGRVFPRFIELRKKGDQSQWTVTIDTAHGPHQDTPSDTKTLTLDFQSNQSLLRLAIPQMTPGEYVRLTIVNAQETKDVQILGVRLYFHVQPGQFALDAGVMNG